MRKQSIKRNYEASPSGQLMIVLSNTKFNYTHFQQFHEVVLNILNDNDLSHLTKIQKENTLFFINMILSLLESPKKTEILEDGGLEFERLSAKKTVVLGNQDSISHRTLAQNYNLASEESLQTLLDWIDEIVLLKRITVEKMLDEFYGLGLVELKL